MMHLTESEIKIYFTLERIIVMKKVFAMILALAMVLSMGITAFAAEGTGSITITNATINETYSLYKIFNATFSSADSSAVAYTLGNNTAACQVMFGADGTTENASW